MIKAKELLEQCDDKMTKAEILAIVREAADDLVLLDKHDMAETLNVTEVAVRKYAQKHNIGIKLRGQRIFTPSDINLFPGRE